MLFDKLKLKFNESKFASTVRPGQAPLLAFCVGTDGCFELESAVGWSPVCLLVCVPIHQK